MASLSDLKTYRDALSEAYYRGVLSVDTGDVKASFQSSDKMRRALMDLERKISTIEGTLKRPRSSGIDLRGVR